MEMALRDGKEWFQPVGPRQSPKPPFGRLSRDASTRLLVNTGSVDFGRSQKQKRLGVRGVDVSMHVYTYVYIFSYLLLSTYMYIDRKQHLIANCSNFFPVLVYATCRERLTNLPGLTVNPMCCLGQSELDCS